ncbi:AI-2E family transporter [Enterococcus sp. BWB1-3]|uniref:AI-2E family transporter n=1 Tax=unclassified Enterococcus TaxID=2608891 RepID=UPI001921F7A8|nr:MULTISPECIES: AI-2E family transporter [unclassified Enterococcus]MBL1229020.1 AI-2E family transporter [Enterococcus sp. BWB1-3]MCB5952289.1 AI-2E family transporter [Enterococcus sp. BWT-B8]
MFEKLKQSKLMFWSVELLVLATLILVSSKINFIFEPIGTFFSTLFAPVLVAGFLYYVLNPLVNLLMKLKVKRIWAIVLVFLLLIAAIILILVSIIPSLANQLASLAASMPEFIRNAEIWFYEMASLPIFKDLDLTSYIERLDISYGNIIQQFLSGLSNSLGSIVSTVASTTIVIFTSPFILFYMLKDGSHVIPALERFMPKKRRTDLVELLEKLDKTLSSYISGQAIECLFVGTFTIIGYSIIGVRYAFLFGVIAGLTNLIPYLGPYLGLAPAVLVTIFDDPFKALLCCIVVLIVQQLDGNIIYPNVIGKTLKIHPLAIILILLVAGNIAGLLGIFLGVPFYAVCRTIVIYIIETVRKSKKEEREALVLEDSIELKNSNQ